MEDNGQFEEIPKIKPAIRGFGAPSSVTSKRAPRPYIEGPLYTEEDYLFGSKYKLGMVARDLERLDYLVKKHNTQVDRDHAIKLNFIGRRETSVEELFYLMYLSKNPMTVEDLWIREGDVSDSNHGSAHSRRETRYRTHLIHFLRVDLRAKVAYDKKVSEGKEREYKARALLDRDPLVSKEDLLELSNLLGITSDEKESLIIKDIIDALNHEKQEDRYTAGLSKPNAHKLMKDAEHIIKAAYTRYRKRAIISILNKYCKCNHLIPNDYSVTLEDSFFEAYSLSDLDKIAREIIEPISKDFNIFTNEPTGFRW